MEREGNSKLIWETLQEDKYFCDVILACDDKHIKTHKVILSSCSSIFRNIIKQNENKLPFIYLEGIRFKDLRNLHDFMYRGEVNIASDDLHSFLKVAEDLKIKGLSEGNGINLKRLEQSTITKGSLVVKNNIENHKREPNLIFASDLKLLMRTGGDFQPDDEREGLNTQKEAIGSSSNTNTIHNENVEQKIFCHNEETLFSCDKCDKTFPYKNSLRRHSTSIREEVRYKCGYCDLKVTDKSYLLKHVRSMHENINLLLKNNSEDHKSDQNLIFGSNLKQLTRSGCDDRENYEKEALYTEEETINTDKFTLLNSSNITNNKTNNESIKLNIFSEKEESIFSCNKCDKQFPYKSSLRRHTSSTHEEIRYTCDYCNLKLTDKSNLLKHVRLKHRNTNLTIQKNSEDNKSNKSLMIAPNIKRLRERSCDESNVTDIPKFLHSSINAKIYSGNIKSKLFFQKKKKLFQCDKCDKQFHYQKTLHRHANSIHEGVRYTCEYCGLKVVDKSYLVKHIRSIHRKIRDYVCFQCDFKSATKKSLIGHTMSFHGCIDLKCDKCDYLTTSTPALKQHIEIIHNQENPFLCDKCDQTFPYRKNLSRHNKSVHLGIRYHCDHCEYSATVKKNLEKHKKSVHD